MTAGTRILAMGHYQPSRVVTNDDLAATIDTNDEWIKSRVGISERRIADGESVADMATFAAEKALAASGLTAADIDLFVAHQANSRIIETAAAELGVPADKVVLNIGEVANTSSASIPLALAQAERDGRLRPGATVVLAAFGAGFVWGAGVISWKERRHVCA